MDVEAPMGNLKDKTFDEIWSSEQARKVREQVRHCNKNCWMIGSAAPAMKKNLKIPIAWIIQNKLFSKKEGCGK